MSCIFDQVQPEIGGQTARLSSLADDLVSRLFPRLLCVSYPNLA